MSEIVTDGTTPAEPGAATRDRILDAAERLFAERGYVSASIRDITAAAGVNLAAVNYHFGGKESLYQEMMLRRVQGMRERRLEAIRASRALASSERTLEDLLRRLAAAILEPADDPQDAKLMLQLFSREATEPRMPRDVFQRVLISPVEDAFCEALADIAPGIDRESASLSLTSLVAQVLHFVRAGGYYGTLETREVRGVTFDRIVRHIVKLTAAGIRELARTTPR